MVAGNVTSFSDAAARRGRKTVSFHDKLEEARERRAVALSRQTSDGERVAMAAPAPLRPARAAPAPIAATEAAEPVAPEPEPPTLAEDTYPADAPTGQRTKWIIRGLTVVLLVLTGAAIHQLPSEPRALPPDFSPPVVRLSAQAYGPPLLASVSYRIDRPLRAVERLPLPDALPGAAPALRISAPAPRGPQLTPFVAAPAAPSATPAILVVLPNDVRPPERPQSVAYDRN